MSGLIPRVEVEEPGCCSRAELMKVVQKSPNRHGVRWEYEYLEVEVEVENPEPGRIARCEGRDAAGAKEK